MDVLMHGNNRTYSDMKWPIWKTWT